MQRVKSGNRTITQYVAIYIDVTDPLPYQLGIDGNIVAKFKTLEIAESWAEIWAVNWETENG